LQIFCERKLLQVSSTTFFFDFLAPFVAFFVFLGDDSDDFVLEVSFRACLILSTDCDICSNSTSFDFKIS